MIPTDYQSGVVYAVVDRREPWNVRYVGKTNRGLGTRIRGHWSSTGRAKTPFSKWLLSREAERENVEFRVLGEYATVSETNEAEIAEIKRFRELGMCDLNITDGGEGSPWNPLMREYCTPFVPRGEAHHAAKMNWDLVREIRSIRSKEWISDSDLGARYGVSPTCVSQVLRNKTWKDPEYDPGIVIKPSRLDYAPSGDEHSMSKLTWDKVREIRSIRSLKWVSSSDLAKKYGVSFQQITSVLRNVDWHDPSFDPGNIVKCPRSGENSKHRKLTWDDVRNIRESAMSGYISQRQLGKMFGTSQVNVGQILRNEIWVDPGYDPKSVVPRRKTPVAAKRRET